MRLGVHFPSLTHFPTVIDDIVDYERAGADVVWIGESSGYDAVSAMGAIAAATSTIQLGFGILPLHTRTPTLLAMTAAGIDALSGGRTILGLGVSGPQIIEGFHDVSFDRPLARTRAVVETCRALWRGERITSERLTQGNGEPYPGVRLFHRGVRSTIPIFLASLGDRSVTLMAEIADGWSPAFFWPERSTMVWGEALACGLARRATDLAPLQITVTVPLAIGESTDEAMAIHRSGLARYIGTMGTSDVNFYFMLAQRYGIGEAADEIKRRCKAGDMDGATAAVPDDFAEATCLIGDERAIASRVQTYADAGVTILTVTPIGEERSQRVRQIERFRAVLGTRR